jgi:uncharacterized protein HemY
MNEADTTESKEENTIESLQQEAETTNNPEIYLKLVILYREQKNYDKAWECLDIAESLVRVK